jgi:hypothetical protein
LGAALRLLLAMPFMVVGSALLAWVAVTELWTAKGFDWAMWAARYFGEDPVSFGNKVINMTGSIAFCGIVAVIVGMALGRK